MENWLKQHILTLVLVLGTSIGVYAGTVVKIETALNDVTAIEHRVDKVEKRVEDIPLLRSDVDNIQKDMEEMRPILEDLGKGVQQLNITLTELRGDLKATNKDVEQLQEEK